MHNALCQYSIDKLGSDLASVYFVNAKRRFNLKGKRLFDINVEGKVYSNIDLFALGGMLTAFTIKTVKIVEDGAVSIKFTNANPVVGTPKINGIAIKLVSPHYAHSVSNGPYAVVDLSRSGVATVPVDGSNSHTHGPGLTLNQWIWKNSPNGRAVSFRRPRPSRCAKATSGWHRNICSRL